MTIQASAMTPMTLSPKNTFVLLPRAVTLQDGKKHVFSNEDLRTLVTAFKALGRPLPIDYEHQTLGSMPGFEHFRSPDGTAPAAGWIAALEVTPEGIAAQQVAWNGRASAMIANREYCYYSPTIFWQGQPWNSKPAALGPVGLTNDPDINNLQAIAARAAHAPMSQDHVGHTEAFKRATPEQQQLHTAILEYASRNGCSYAEACRTMK